MAVEEQDDTKKSEAEGASHPTEKATGQALESKEQCDEEEPSERAEEENLELKTKDEETIGDQTKEKKVEEPFKDEEERGNETEEIKSEQETEMEEGDEGAAEGEHAIGDEKEKSVSISPKTPSDRRPTRERKIVERYSAASPVGRPSGSKVLCIAKGSGTLLKDIPNVAYKLSKRKPDDNLQLLHTILFGKRAKAHTLKRDIGNFSGFVWTENEEKQKTKIKEKLEKCVKEKLLDFCDVLNIPVSKATLRKEDLIVKLFEFLQSPCPTTDVLLSEKNLKGKKRKSKGMSSRSANSKEASTGKSSKKARVGEKQKETSRVEEESDHDDNEEYSDAEVEFVEQDDEDQAPMAESDKDSDSEEGHNSKEVTPKSSSKKIESKSEKKTTDSKKNGTGKSSDIMSKLTKKASSSLKNAVAASEAPASQGNSSSRKKSKVDTESTEQSDKKQSGNSSSKPKIKEGRSTSSKTAEKEPTREDLYSVVVQILKEADFDTATLSDILRQLGTHFNLDLMHRKAEVKEIITKAINNMSDEEDAEEEEDKNSDESGDNAEETGDDKDDV